MVNANFQENEPFFTQKKKIKRKKKRGGRTQRQRGPSTGSFPLKTSFESNLVLLT
jgi:hypothetical protein